MVFSLVYVSAASADLTTTQLRALVRQSRVHNAAAEITGVLLYRHGTFLQMLEGDRDQVEAVFTAIQADPRNHDVTVVRRREQPERDFPNWTMGFGDIGPGSSPIAIESPPPEGPVPQTETEAAFLLELLDFFDPPP